MPQDHQRQGLPPRPFLYTIDQVAYLLQIEESSLKKNVLHFEGRSVGVGGREKIIARNIMPAGVTPDWRITERELIRYMKLKGFKFYERGYVQS
jgi:hypothetical protein